MVIWMSEGYSIDVEDGVIVYCEVFDYAPEECKATCPFRDMCDVNGDSDE